MDMKLSEYLQRYWYTSTEDYEESCDEEYARYMLRSGPYHYREQEEDDD